MLSDLQPFAECREELVLWVRKKTGDALTTVTSKEEAHRFLSTNVTVVLGYFAKLEVGSRGASLLG